MAAAGAIVCLAAIGLSINLVIFNDESRRLRTVANGFIGLTSAFDLERTRLNRDYTPDVLLANAGDYLDASGAFGSIGDSPSQLARAAEPVRISADSHVIGSLGLRLADGQRSGSASRAPPEPVRITAGSAVRDDGCVLLRPRSDGAGASSGPASPTQQKEGGNRILATLRLPPGGAVILPQDPGHTSAYLGRFGPPVTQLDADPMARTYSLRIPLDGSRMPWTLLISSIGEVTICGHSRESPHS